MILMKQCFKTIQILMLYKQENMLPRLPRFSFNEDHDIKNSTQLRHVHDMYTTCTLDIKNIRRTSQQCPSEKLDIKASNLRHAAAKPSISLGAM